MKKTIIVVFIILFQVASVAQSISNIQGKIKYRTILKENTENTRNYNLVSYLYFTKDQSVFVYDRIKDMEEKDKYERRPYQKDKELPLPLNDTSYYPHWRKRDEYGQIFFKNNITKLFKIRELVVGRPYITEEPIPIIHWNIISKGKKIGKYNCQEAVAKFRGRIYHVWFTAEIPINVGPWKLQGLPGVILEAKSEDGKVAFIAEEIEVPCNKDFTDEIHALAGATGKVISFDEYKTIYQKEDEKQITMFLSLLQQEMDKNGIKSGRIEPSQTPPPFRIELEF